MFPTRVHLMLVGAWFTIIVIGVGTIVALGGLLTPAQTLGVILLAFLPVIVMVGVFRGTPPPTIGEVLYEAEHATNATRDMLIKSIHPARKSDEQS